MTSELKKKGHNQWKKSKRSTRKNYLKNLTLKFDFSIVVIGSDIRAILYAFVRDLPLFIEKNHFTLEETLAGGKQEDLAGCISFKDYDRFKSSLLFIMNMNGKVFGFEEIRVESNMVKTEYETFFINECFYSKLVDPFNPIDKITVIDEIDVKLTREKRKLVKHVDINNDQDLVNKILHYNKKLYCLSYLEESDLQKEENKLFNVKFRAQDLLEKNGIKGQINNVVRNVKQHRRMKIDFGNYHDISRILIRDIIDVEESGQNMELYEKLGQNIF